MGVASSASMPTPAPVVPASDVELAEKQPDAAARAPAPAGAASTSAAVVVTVTSDAAAAAAGTSGTARTASTASRPAAIAPDSKAALPVLPADVTARLVATDRVVDVVRHGQSEYNAYKESWWTRLTCRCWCCCDPKLRDPALSAEGRAQVRRLHAYLRTTHVCATVQLVLVSPLQRAVATALGAFGVADPNAKADDEKIDDADHNAPAMAVPPFAVLPALREVMDTWSDVGSSRDTLLRAFAHAPAPVRASLAELPAEGGWWYYNVRKGRDSVTAEPAPVLHDRMDAVRAYVLSRPERHVCLVGHSGFFKAWTGARFKLDNCQLARFVLHADGRLTPVPLPTPQRAMAAAAAAGAGAGAAAAGAGAGAAAAAGAGAGRGAAAAGAGVAAPKQPAALR